MGLPISTVEGTDWFYVFWISDVLMFENLHQRKVYPMQITEAFPHVINSLEGRRCRLHFWQKIWNLAWWCILTSSFILETSGHAQITRLLQNAAFFIEFCCKSMYLKKYLKDFNETWHETSPWVGGYFYQIWSCCSNQKGCCSLLQI